MLAAALALPLLALSSCATSGDAPVVLKGRPQVTLAERVEETAGTRLGRTVGPAVAAHPGLSAFRLIDTSREAYDVRLALIESAEETLDAQYYLWRSDATGTVLLERLMSAADRGVRVRLLIDDVLYDRDDSKVAALAAHPNVQIRLYNPFGADGTASFTRVLQLLTNLQDLNHRMHNKFMIADNQVVVMGGRNIGDKYFGLSHTMVFRDIDVLASGPVVQQSSGAFDAYWNGELAIPIEGRFRAILSRGDYEREHDELRQKVAQLVEQEGYPYPTRMSPNRAVSLLRPGGGAAGAPDFWCSARLVVDTTHKRNAPVEAGGPETHDSPTMGRAPAGMANARPAGPSTITTGSLVAPELARLVQGAQREVVLESAYLVPDELTLDLIDQTRERAVAVSLLTNSLMSTNHPYVHSFYAKTRPRMIASGADVHELNVHGEALAIHSHYPETKFGLHAKTLVIDRRLSFVGTLNVDPRSVKWNTESGVVIESEAFAEHLLEKLARDFDPANSWKVTLDADGRLLWQGEENGQAVEHRVEPGSTRGDRFLNWFYGILPIGDQV